MYYPYYKSVLLVALILSFWHNALVCATFGSSSDDFPCPLPEDIEPCTCSYNLGQSTLNLDCSGVMDGDQLAQVLQAPFPATAFNNFTIDSNNFLTEIKNNTFGPVTFEEVWISFSALETIQINAFAGLESCLKRLYLYHNKINKFPFFVLENFTVLEELSLLYNDITHIPIISSETLTYLELGLNPIQALPLNPFILLPSLVDLKMESTGLDQLKPGLFVFNTKLEYISLWGNHLRELEPYWLSFPEAPSMKIIYLNHNYIDVVKQETFTGLRNTSIYLEYNKLTTMEEHVWRQVLQGNNTIHLRGNHLACECDIAWLVWDRPLLDQLDEAKCSNGIYLADLDPGSFDGCGTSTVQPITS